VSIYSASRERSPEDIRASLFQFVRTFESDAHISRKLIRELLENDRDLFYASSIDVLKTLPESRGMQHLVALMAANGMLLEALCDPSLNKDQAMSLGRMAVRVNPAVDASLARGLADSETGQGTILVRDGPRLMEILCEVGDPSRMTASMLRLLRHPNERLRSQAVKVVGRGSKSAKWVRQRLNEPDPRIRANAIEALWSVATEEARILLQYAAADSHNRVAANALMGLYYLGECSVLTELVKMAHSESALFRSSAAWAMGETRDFRFSETLRRLLNDGDPTVRKRAFAALAKLKTAAAQIIGSGTWHVAGRWLAGESAKGTRRLMVAVAGEDARELPKIPSLGFVLSEAGTYVTSYRVTEKPAPDPMSVVFLLPRGRQAAQSFTDGIESCLKWKRPGDLWCILPYVESGDGGPPAGEEESIPPFFTTNADVLRRALNGPADRLDCGDLWTSLWEASRTEKGATRGRRHIIVLSTAEEARIAGHGLIATVKSARLGIHAVASGSNTHLQDFCRAVQAPFHVCSADDLADAVRHTYLSFLARYEVVYYPVSVDSPELKVRVQAPGGWGERLIPNRTGPAV
jgi:hypothetical protein